jgi:hypothetical protein
VQGKDFRALHVPDLKANLFALLKQYVAPNDMSAQAMLVLPDPNGGYDVLDSQYSASGTLNFFSTRKPDAHCGLARVGSLAMLCSSELLCSGSHPKWRMLASSAVGLWSSHRNGGGVLLIFVANPTIGR